MRYFRLYFRLYCAQVAPIKKQNKKHLQFLDEIAAIRSPWGLHGVLCAVTETWQWTQNTDSAHEYAGGG